jgi:sialidase-1
MSIHTVNSRTIILLAFVTFALCLSCTFRDTPQLLSEGFSDFPPGSLTEIKTNQLNWTGVEGHAAITDRKSKFTPNALRIHGGEHKVVTVEPVKDIGRHQKITFWAERWTYRDPFEFTVSGLTGNGWEVLYDGSQVIKTGNFPAYVEIPLGSADYTKYRFTCTSPENTGILIDDLRIYNDAPLQVDSVTVDHVHVPVLRRNTDAPILKVKVHTSGINTPMDLKRITTNLSGTIALTDLNSVRLYYTGNNPAFSTTNQVAEAGEIVNNIELEGTQTLKEGINFFWISVAITDNADIMNAIDAGCTEIVIGSKTFQPVISNPEGMSRMGIALRRHSDDHVDTYRIPGLVTTNHGTLIAVYDIRYNNATDLQEDVDIGMNRSTDGGKTWAPMKVIMDMGEWGGLPNDQNGIGDPAILVDRQTGTIWVAAVWAHGHPGQRNWWASKPGMTPEQTSQLMLVKSDDDGLTWSKTINITNQIKQPEWHLILQGPGKGITLKNGTLVFPAQYKDENQMPQSTIIWSKDHGHTWHIGTGAKLNTTEAQVIERDDGSLMLNMRDNRNRSDHTESNGRSVYITHDMGKSWAVHPTSRTNVLQESTCQASLIKEDFLVNNALRSLVIFSNPNTKSGRHHMSVKISFDDGDSWDLDKTLMLDEGDGRGYSCMTKVDDRTLGILYEGSQADITFQLIPIDDIAGKR